MVKSARITAAKVTAQRKALMVLKKRYLDEIAKIEKQLERPANVQLEVPKEIVKVDVSAPQVQVDAPQVEVRVPENAIQVNVQAEPPTVNTPVQVTIPQDAIKVNVQVQADPPVLPPVTPPQITFSPKMPELPGSRTTTYLVKRHETTNWITEIQAIDHD